MAPIGNAVFATLLMNDGYLPGAMVLGHSLRDRGAKGKLVVFIVVDRLSQETITELKTVYDDVVPVQQIMNKTPANLYLMDRPDLIATFTKIELWKQTQYDRIVYIDADMVALRAPNELLTMDTKFAAVPDIGWPDCFNSGLLVLNPDMAEYYALLALAERGISFDGADQGLLNMHFSEWERLSFTYNCTPSGNYQYLPAYRHFQSSINMIHFIGKEKPWTLGRDNRRATGVYSELLGRWWTVYDRHYRSQETVYYSGDYRQAPKKVQDHVAGEETIYLPAYQAPRSQPDSSQPQPSIVVNPPTEETPAPIEQPMGDQPAVAEQIQKNEFKPTPTVQQRRFSAPHAEWEPARAPPPTNSKPEASNFPSTQYEMSASKELFRPPASYPEAPKDMWYEVPVKTVQPSKPKAIFPWEDRAPKPTRVFAEPKLPSPPPEPESPLEEQEAGSDLDADASTLPDASVSTTEAVEAPKEPYVDPWTTFNQRTNAWDDMPEIAKYMQSLNQAKKGKIQVLHHSPSTTTGRGDLMSSALGAGRRDSLRITDFPTEIERPSLPVTPAPRRRSITWGEEKGDEVSDLPVAEGVPKQAEWVRRFSSYPEPVFAAVPSPSPQVDNVTYFTCQHCGKQNPVDQLEQLQRKQSEALLNKPAITVKDPPKREMPESTTKEEVVIAAEKAMSPPAKMPLKPILKEPSFEIPKPATQPSKGVSEQPKETTQTSESSTTSTKAQDELATSSQTAKASDSSAAISEQPARSSTETAHGDSSTVTATPSSTDAFNSSSNTSEQLFQPSKGLPQSFTQPSPETMMTAENPTSSSETADTKQTFSSTGLFHDLATMPQ